MTEEIRLGPEDPPAGRWDPSLLPQVADINARVLGLLKVSSRESGAIFSPLVPVLHSHWEKLTTERLRLLAECPYLLLDVASALPHYGGNVSGDRCSEGKTRGYGGVLKNIAWSELVHHALVFAWHLARANPFAAQIILGTNGSSTALIAATSLQDLEHLVSSRPECIRPRWEDRPHVWRQFLHAAVEDPPARLRQMQLRGLQMLAGSVLTQCSSGASSGAAFVRH